MSLDWKLIRSIWIAILIPVLIVAAIWTWPIGIEKWERYQRRQKIQQCETDMTKIFGRELNTVESAELLHWCTHRASGGLFDQTYQPLLPSLWKEYYRRVYPGTDACKAHPALC